MPIPAIVGAAGIAAGANLLGGLLNSNSQSKTNRTNLQIARENNQTSVDIANRNNQLSYDMFLQQLAYESPSEQRRMLEAAGYNPYSLLQGVRANSPSSPSLQQPTLSTPTMQPNFALGNMLSTLGQNAANMYESLNKSELLKAQTNAQNIANDYAADNLAEDIRGKRAANDYAEKSIQDRLENVALNNQFLMAQRKLVSAQAVSQCINNKTLAKMNESQIAQIVAITDYYLETKNTQKALQDYYQAGVRYQDAQALMTKVQTDWIPYNAQTQRISANAQQTSASAQVVSSKASMIQANSALINAVSNMRTQSEVAQYYKALTQNQRNVNAIFDMFGMKSAAVQYDKLVSEAASGRLSVKQLAAKTKLTLFEIEKAILNNKMLSNDLKMYWIDKIFGYIGQGVGTAGGAFRDYGIGSKMITPPTAAGSVVPTGATTPIPMFIP